MRLENPDAYGLPMPSWREHQREKTEEVLDAFSRNKYVLLKAPTGAGKSLMAAATAGSQRWFAAYLSETIHLQEQYLRTMPDAVTVTGRRNHACEISLGRPLTAEEGPCPCTRATDEPCSYYAQWWAAEAARDVVLNYAFATRVMRIAGIKVGPEKTDTLPNPFKHRDLMVCDEGHLLERALLAAAGADVRASSLERCEIAPPPEGVGLEGWQDWARANYDDAEAQVSDFWHRVRGLLGAARQVPDNVRLAVRRWRSVFYTIKTIADMDPDTPVVCQRTSDGWSLRPVWVWGQADELLFRYASRVLIMSATLGAPWLIARLLGLPEGSVETVEVPTTFPPEIRPVYFWPVAKMKHGMPGSEKIRQAQALDYLAWLGDFAHQKGIVHCNSYELGRFLYENVLPQTRARILLHTAETREEAFKQFFASEDPIILMSPAAATGVDWPYQVGWQMIPKMPFADLSDQLVRARFEYVSPDGEKLGRIVYAHEAANTLIQACGRCTRAEDDKGVTVITDENFWTNFRFTAADAYPEWFREAVSRYQPKRR